VVPFQATKIEIEESGGCLDPKLITKEKVRRSARGQDPTFVPTMH
jgi:hypothetical protein